VARLRKIEADKELCLEDIFLFHDETKDGTITHVQFKYILSEKCGFKKDEYEMLADFLDYNGTGLVNYKELIKLMKDPKLIDSIPLRGMDYIMTN